MKHMTQVYKVQELIFLWFEKFSFTKLSKKFSSNLVFSWVFVNFIPDLQINSLHLLIFLTVHLNIDQLMASSDNLIFDLLI